MSNFGKFIGCVAIVKIQGSTYCTLTLPIKGLTELEYVNKILGLDCIIVSEDSMCRVESYVDTLIAVTKEEDFDYYFKILNREANRLANLTEHPRVTSIRFD